METLRRRGPVDEPDGGDYGLRMVSHPAPVHLFDTRALGLDAFTGVYLIDGPEPVLVDAGTKESAGALVGWLRKMNVVPRCVVVTHAHYDHIGGLAAVLRAFGRNEVEVLASPGAAQRLRDPNAVNRLYTAEELEPVDGVRAVRHGEVLQLRGLRLEFLWTPGHSEDSISVHELEMDTLFAGDLPGDWLWGNTFLPPNAAVDFDEAAYRRSMERVRLRGAKRLALPHYGFFEGAEADALLSEQLARYERWKSALLEAYEAGSDEAVAARVRSLLSGSRFESMPQWETVATAFARWCMMGLENAGLVTPHA